MNMNPILLDKTGEKTIAVIWFQELPLIDRETF